MKCSIFRANDIIWHQVASYNVKCCLVRFIDVLYTNFHSNEEIFYFALMENMDLRDKSVENKTVAVNCLKWKTYNAGASRAYYSAFQMAKYYLKSKKFDYKSFLAKYPKFSGEKDYSHGSLQCALFDFFQKNGKKIDMKKVNVIDNLYAKRRVADYNAEGIIEHELRYCIEQLNLFLTIFE